MSWLAKCLRERHLDRDDTRHLPRHRKTLNLLPPIMNEYSYTAPLLIALLFVAGMIWTSR